MESGPERLRRLTEPVHQPALAFARGLCRSRAEGDDLFQEAVLRALHKLDDLRDDRAFRHWLYRIIVSVHRNRCRRAFWRRFVPLDDHAPAVLPHYDQLGAADRARVALAALPAPQREAIVLFELEGWRVDEIAAVCGVSASAVKSRLARGRNRLRAFYERRFGLRRSAPALASGESHD